MKRALVLSSGAAWCGFQIGALEYLVAEREYTFDIFAGTGIGAMNAAFVACDEFEALQEFWNRIGWLKLISFNWKHPLSRGLFTGKPQKQFIQQHLSVEKLHKNNATLVFNTLNIVTGKQVYFTYPGSEVPLAEALVTALTIPGFMKARKHVTCPLGNGMFVNSFILDHVITQYEADEYYGMAVSPAGTVPNNTPKKYVNWRQAALRTLQINLSRDIRKAFKKGDDKLQAARAYQNVEKELEEKIVDVIQDTDVRQKILYQISRGHKTSERSLNKVRESALYKITTEREVESPLWSFRKKYIRQLKEEGYKTAQNTVQ